MKELKDYLDERYPSRLSDDSFGGIYFSSSGAYFAVLIGLSLGILGALDFSFPELGTEVARKAPPSSTVVFIILALVSGIGTVVMSYMIYKRRQKRTEASKLIHRYVHQKSEGKEDIAGLAKDARFIDEGELFELINDLSKTDILENL